MVHQQSPFAQTDTAKAHKCILIAEDNPADVYLIRESLSEQTALDGFQVTVASDGEEALDYLLQRGDFADARRPDLIVLDLNLPKVDGIEILQTMRERPELAGIPVVVFTSSDSPVDRKATEQLGADQYITKPTDLDAFMQVGGALLSYVKSRK